MNKWFVLILTVSLLSCDYEHSVRCLTVDGRSYTTDAGHIEVHQWKGSEHVYWTERGSSGRRLPVDSAVTVTSGACTVAEDDTITASRRIPEDE